MTTDAPFDYSESRAVLIGTSESGELLDLVRVGIADGPEELTLQDIYPHLRVRLGEVDLPEPRSGGTGNVGTFWRIDESPSPTSENREDRLPHYL